MREKSSPAVFVRLPLSLVLVAALAVTLSCGPGEQAAPDTLSKASQALTPRGGPVILGGDDLTDHGSVSETGIPQAGWYYIRTALENLKVQVNRPNDGTVAVLGSRSSTLTSGDAGAAYYYTVPLVGMRAQFYEGTAQLESFFAGLKAGTKRPAILIAVGSGADNDLDSFEGVVLSNHAGAIADFVNSGGGLLAHGYGTDAYGWLTTLIPGIIETMGCDSSTLSLTTEGQQAFPGLTNAHIRAGPCHSNFSGDLGDLKVLARDSRGRNIILGGASVQLPGSITLSPVSATYEVGSVSSHRVTATARDGNSNPLPGVTITFVVESGPNAGATGTAVSNASGQASFTYASRGVAGTDLIKASFVDNTGTLQTSPTVEAIWTRPPNGAPVARAGGPYTTPEGSSVALSGAASSDPDGDALTFTWDLDADGLYDDASGVTASFFGADGPKSHTVGLRVCDTAGACATTTARVNVVNVAPSVLAVADQTVSRNAPVSVSGTWTDPAGAADNAYTWAWDLNGDGSFDVSGQSPFGSTNTQTTSFAAGGTYTLTFRVTDKDGASHSDTVTITVVNRPPVASAGGPYTTPEGSSVALSGAASSDPDGDALTFAWDLDGDGGYDDASGATAAFFGVDGPSTRTVGLRVCDSAGDCATTTATVHVLNVAPTAVAEADHAVFRNTPVSVSGTWTDPAGAHDNAYTWEWDLDGDGSFDVSGQSPFGSTNTQTTSFAALGTYTLTLRVTDKDGASHSDTVTVTVVNRAPVASAGGPYTTPEGTTVTLDGGGSSDADGDALTFAWDLDWDGSYDNGSGATANFFGVDGPGTHQVGLKVCDSAGACATTTATVHVVNVAPTVVAEADQTIFRNTPVSVSGTWTDPAGAADNAYTWTWDLDGDGNADLTGQASYGMTVAQTTSFAALGTYTLTLRVADKDGASHSDTVTLTVVNRPPVASAGGPYTTPEGASVALDGSGSFDADGDALTFAWDLDGDGGYDDASGATASFFGVDGPSTHTVGLQVCDSAGDCTTTTATVSVLNVAPTAIAEADQTVFRNTPVSVSGTWTDPAGSADDAYTWEWDLDGDGSFDVSGQSPFGSTNAQTTSFAALGTYTLTFRVTDKDGGSHSDTVTVTVVNRAPECSAAAPSVSLIWPPNHQMVGVSVQGVTDADNDPIAITIGSIRQDEPVNAIGDGNTDVDGTGIGTSVARVRAERSGTKQNFGNGRVYHIGYTADDGQGGSCSGVVKVGVPHDQGGKAQPIDDGPLYDSTKP